MHVRTLSRAFLLGQTLRGTSRSSSGLSTNAPKLSSCNNIGFSSAIKPFGEGDNGPIRHGSGILPDNSVAFPQCHSTSTSAVPATVNYEPAPDLELDSEPPLVSNPATSPTTAASENGPMPSGPKRDTAATISNANAIAAGRHARGTPVNDAAVNPHSSAPPAGGDTANDGIHCRITEADLRDTMRHVQGPYRSRRAPHTLATNVNLLLDILDFAASPSHLVPRPLTIKVSGHPESRTEVMRSYGRLFDYHYSYLFAYSNLPHMTYTPIKASSTITIEYGGKTLTVHPVGKAPASPLVVNFVLAQILRAATEDARKHIW